MFVFIPAFNATEDIDKLVYDIKAQNGEYEIKVSITDSSTDLSLQAKLREIGGIDFLTINNSQFSHGGTRRQAIDKAIKERFDYIVFTVQDAQIYDKSWLENLIEPYEADHSVACVFGKQVAYRHHNPLVKAFMELAFQNISPENEMVIHSADIPETPGTFFNSHVNSSYRLSYFKNGLLDMPAVNYAEDQYMAKQIIEKGLKKIYNPKSKVYHSHAWDTPFEYFQRYYDEYRGLKESTNFVAMFGRKSLLKMSWISGRMAARLVMEREEGFIWKFKWAVLAYPIELYKHLAMFLVARDQNIPSSMKNLLSRESMQKKFKTNRLGFRKRVKVYSFLIWFVLFVKG